MIERLSVFLIKFDRLLRAESENLLIFFVEEMYEENLL